MTTKPTEVIWQETRCPLCRGDEAALMLEVTVPQESTPYRLMRCRACGIGYLNPRPTAETIGHYYPPEYANYQPPVQKRAKKRWKEQLERLVLARFFGYPSPPLSWHEKLMATLSRPWIGPRADSLSAVPFTGAGRLLDYGCGAGIFAQRMRQRGWDVVAMDFNEHTIEQVRRRYGLTAIAGMLPHPEINAESFDVVTMGSVLEHVHEPHELIASIVRILRPGGVLAISVPNLDSWQYRYFGKEWWSLELPRHLLHFTPATLRRLMETHGLVVRDLVLPGRTGWMRRSLSLARKAGRNDLFVKIGRWPLVPSLLTHYTVQTQQSDCIQVMATKPGKPIRQSA
ncbi:MAG: class I SAM-dependent methyltransferase [Gemmataceae bacterium]